VAAAGTRAEAAGARAAAAVLVAARRVRRKKRKRPCLVINVDAQGKELAADAIGRAEVAMVPRAPTFGKKRVNSRRRRSAGRGVANKVVVVPARPEIAAEVAAARRRPSEPIPIPGRIVPIVAVTVAR
jgi:hypothetical protein